MFGKLKQLKDLRSQAKTMQSALSEEKIITEKNDVRLVMNGNMDVIELEINSNSNKEELAKTIKSLVNDSIKKTQKLMARKMQEMGGFPGLS